MTTKLNETITSSEYDELINSPVPEADVCSVTIKGLTETTELKRGTVLAVKDGKAEVLGSNTEGAVASHILADNVTVGTADTHADAYRAGHFNRNKLIVAEGYTLTKADEEELRKVGILLDDAIKA